MSFNISYNIEALDQFSPVSRRINKSINSLSKNMTTFNERMMKGARSFDHFAKGVTMKLSAPLAAFGVFAVKAAVTFQQAINMVGADTDATAKQLSILRQEALKYGATTQFTATQVAQAEMFLGRAGTKVNQIMTMLPGVLQLAASSQLDMGSAAKIVIQVMRGYGMQAKDLAHVNNVLVKAFTSSNTDLVGLGETFKLAGPIMKSAGVRFEDAASLIAVLGNAGIQATMAGTGMRKVVAGLIHPNAMLAKSMKKLHMTFVDSRTGQLDLIKAMTQLHDHGITTAGALTAFGVRGGNALAALMEHYFGMLKMNEALKHTGNIAQRIATAQMKGLPGTVKLLTSAFGNMRLELVDSVTPALTKLMGWLTKIITKLNDSSSGFRHWTAMVGGAVIAAGPFLMVLGKIYIALALLASRVPVAAAVLEGLGVAFSFVWRSLLGPIGLIITMGTAIWWAYHRFVLVRKELNFLAKAFDLLTSPVKLAHIVVNGVTHGIEWLSKALGKLWGHFAKLHPKLAAFGKVWLESLVGPIELAIKGIETLIHSVEWLWSKLHHGAIRVHHQIEAERISRVGTQAPGAPLMLHRVHSVLDVNVADPFGVIKTMSGTTSSGALNLNLGQNMASSR